MCGITGFIDFNKRSTIETLKRMTDIIQHRGPDGEGHYMDESELAFVGLGHRRLSIIDLSNAASQPMFYKHYVIIFNGEIYNYHEIKQHLINKGHTFTTQSDTEVILHAFEEWGRECVHRFIGMFTFVIYDKEAQQVFCIRDRAGVKPFFWYFKDGFFLFGSELKSLHQHPGFKKELNKDALCAFMQFGYVPVPHCIYKYAYKLQPGHHLTIDLSKKDIRIEKYWDVLDAYNRPKLKISLPDAVNESEKILEKAFQYRMVADVPVGVFLSGGYDSTCVTALLQKNSSSKINTFTIGVYDKGLNEAEFAKKTAKHLGTNHTEYYCTVKEALEIVPFLSFYYDEPFADSSAIPTTLVSKLARRHVTVALSADAGDEVFAGYNKYDYLARVKKKIDKVPTPFRRVLANVMGHVPVHRLPYFNRKHLFTNRYKKIMHLLKDNSARKLLLNMSCLYFPDEIEKLLVHQPAKLNTYFDEQLNSLYADDLSYMMAIDYKTYLLDDILQKVDRASMSVSLEGREPFLDQHIIEFAARLPSEYKLYKGIKKYILRQIVHKYVPKQMMERPKMGFGVPVAEWLKDELRPFVEAAFDPTFIRQQGLFRQVEIEKLKRQFYGGMEQLYNKIWCVLMFQLWYKQWMG